MNKIDLVFKSLKKKKKKALIAYLAGGYPNWKKQKELILDMDRHGVDILEVGVPFSDPIADGPTIQFASQKALEAGSSLEKILGWLKSIRTSVQFPFVIMSYMNPLLKFGLDRFAKRAVESGVAGVIIPDLITEEGHEVQSIFRKADLHLIYLAAPTTPQARLNHIQNQTRGFLYAVSVKGVTGARKNLPKETKRWLCALKRDSRYPVCVGFGISGTQQIKMLKSAVDGFIIGSAFIDIIRTRPQSQIKPDLVRFVKELAKECSYGH